MLSINGFQIEKVSSDIYFPSNSFNFKILTAIFSTPPSPVHSSASATTNHAATRVVGSLWGFLPLSIFNLKSRCFGTSYVVLCVGCLFVIQFFIEFPKINNIFNYSKFLGINLKKCRHRRRKCANRSEAKMPLAVFANCSKYAPCSSWKSRHLPCSRAILLHGNKKIK